jgi:hypothetical protein
VEIDAGSRIYYCCNIFRIGTPSGRISDLCQLAYFPNWRRFRSHAVNAAIAANSESTITKYQFGKFPVGVNPESTLTEHQFGKNYHGSKFRIGINSDAIWRLLPL